MLQGLTGWHLLIVVGVIVLLFGSAKLPALARSIGQSARAFKGEMKAMRDDDEADATTVASTPAAAAAPAAQAVAPAATVVAEPQVPATSDPAPQPAPGR
ncbi:Sec-independent protein translocase subunit TatA [Agromyces sp. MMS24-K17]|uniref:Sec-independent protein translocase subunit TatA n=1 Tax=Agromyces sp. MMS24-K17 TaxID=3372850 RepID=UPI0037552F03